MCTEPRPGDPGQQETTMDDVMIRRRKRCSAMPVRYVVVLLGLLGSMMDYLVRYGLSMAIVAMVNTTHPVNHTDLPTDGACPAALNASGSDPDDHKGGGEFDWSLNEQGIILGTFFWGYILTKTTGGRISEIVGARAMMAVSLGLSGLLSMLCPFAAYLHPMALASVRFVMGLAQGPAFPSLYIMVASWAPPDELATMVTVAFSGMSMGSLIAMGSSGWVIEHLGWQWVFWGGGMLALLWTPFWIYFVRNSPLQHPFISNEEKELLEASFCVKPRRHVPWGQLLRCWRFYPSILAEIASTWIANQTNAEGPTFLKTQIGMSLMNVSWVLAAGQTCGWLGSLAFGRITDLILHHNVLTKLNTRRLMHSIGMFMVVMGLLCIVWAECQEWLVAAMLLVVMTGVSTNLCTLSLTPMDIAPNFVGTLSGLLGIGTLSGFVAPIVTAAIVTKTGSWAPSLLLGAGLYLSAGILYVATVTTEVQDWNYYEDLPTSINEEQP